jgi:BirA family biotin operon repressor/biotin-[acetyl-CoA-carboxylase] ligase
MPDGFVSRIERFERLPSTQDVVKRWLHDGVAEVCVAVADTQTQGRGRLDRRWWAPPGRALLVSLGLRPLDLPVELAWRLPAVAALAMRAAADGLLGRIRGRLAVKWPNDLVLVEAGGVRKLGGLLAEGMPAGDRLASAVVGLGVNVDWPAAEFPADLAADMGSLSEAAGGRRVDREALLVAFLEQLEPRYEALRQGRFEMAAWLGAQATTGAEVDVDTGQGIIRGTATGIDEASGALVLHIPEQRESRAIHHGDVVRCRIRPSVLRP